MKFLIATILAMTQVVQSIIIYGGYCSCIGNKLLNQKTFVCEELATDKIIAKCFIQAHQYPVDKTDTYKCIKCEDNYYIDQSYKCRPLANCVKGTYTYNPEAHDCTECKADFHVDNKICVANGSVENCATFSGPANNVICTTCYPYYQINSGGTECAVLKIDDCLTMIGQKCTACKDTFFIVNGGASCGALGFIKHADAITNCAAQSYITNKYVCSSCNSGFYLDAQKVCQANPTEGATFVANCQEYHLVQSNLKCKICDPLKSGPVISNACTAVGVENCTNYQTYTGISNKVFCNKCQGKNSLNFSKLAEDKVTCGQCPLGTFQNPFKLPTFNNEAIKKALRESTAKQQISAQITQITMVFALILALIF